MDITLTENDGKLYLTAHYQTLNTRGGYYTLIRCRQTDEALDLPPGYTKKLTRQALAEHQAIPWIVADESENAFLLVHSPRDPVAEDRGESDAA